MTQPNGSTGLYDNFPERRTPTAEEIADAFARGMIALDANVLLNLYRYSAERREELLNFLHAHREQLFVPHQALKEFWTNRQTVLHSVETEADTTAQVLSGLLNQASDKLNHWANRIGLAFDKRAELDEQLASGFREIEIAIREELPRMTEDLSQDTNEDLILQRLEPIVEGCVGAPLGDSDHKKAVVEGIRRFEAKEPPGFGDKDKKGDARAGDYLVWEQTLREAEVRRLPVVFVTDDAAKSDWYQIVHGKRRGPLPELSAELRRRAEALLVMVPTSRLAPPEEVPTSVPAENEPAAELHRDQYNPVPAGHEPAAAVGQPVDAQGEPNSTASGAVVRQDASDASWTRAALDELLRRLANRAPVQQQALVAALRAGGFVSRDTVYQLGAYERSRTLRGFTRPVSGVCAQLRAEGLLAKDAPDALEAVYESSYSYVQAAGFRVPETLRQLAE